MINKPAIFVLRENGDLKAYLSVQASDDIYVDNKILLYAEKQIKQNLKEVYYESISEFCINEGELESSNQFYLGYDDEKDNIMVLPISYGIFKIPRFDSKENANKVKEIAYSDFNQKQRKIIFTEN